ncbi:MAG: NAD(P)-dependent oxidoreductase, partial [Flavobacteriia bacterium]|nr:NAD(P)-dependent oxidoreductase [Flavobacteriia bacterium]
KSASNFEILSLQSCRINVLGNLNILEACRVVGVQKFILASSVYVNSSEGQFYKCSKIAAENYTKEYQKACLF